MKQEIVPKVIIDTDPGHDDVMALLLAICSKRLDIKAITTVCGNSGIENTTRNAQFVKDTLQVDIPIYSGAPKPMSRDLIKAVVHGESGLDGIDPTNNFILSGDAVDRIIKIAQNEGKNVSIITLGPLTNIALAIKKAPNIMRKINEIVMMGGAVRVPGNKNRVAEFNMFVDPEAADIVFRSEINKTIVPLDACNHVKLYLKDFEEIQNKKLRNILVQMVRPYMENIYKDEGIKAAMMYDPLTIFYYLFPQYAKTERLNILIETESILTRGMSVADLRKKPEARPNVTVVNHIDAVRFRDYFVETLSNTE